MISKASEARDATMSYQSEKQISTEPKLTDCVLKAWLASLDDSCEYMKIKAKEEFLEPQEKTIDEDSRD